MSTEPKIRIFISGLSQEFLDCRQYGHNWTPNNVTKQHGLFDVTLVCPRCDSEATELINQRGDRIAGRHVKYTPGYLNKGMGRMVGDARSSLRLESVMRYSGDKTQP